LKEDKTRRRVDGHEHSSQDTEDSDHEEYLAKAFGVNRDLVEPGLDESTANILLEHRKKKTDWRERHYSK